MSKIEKVSILGIRSFDNRIPMAIKFDTPITLIVGTNGSGKTTIIECLKYMTCGELPPNAQLGKMFVHDPQMAGEKEVLAQVKMSFTSTEGVRMVATRNLQLTAKQKTRSVKALEGSIKMVKEGERNTISSRVGEMNSLLPRYLGVSKAVLENVIFCHQEDSFWPMSTPQQLKEKFDEIFEAQKYTKAIDSIKVLEKNHKIELESLKNDEKHLKAKHEMSKRAKETRDKLGKDAERLKREKESHLRDLQEAQEKSQEFWQKMGEAEMTVGKLHGKRVARDTKLEVLQNLRKNLTEMAETDEKLEQMLAQYEERLKHYDDDLLKRSEDYSSVSEAIESARENLLNKNGEQAGYQKEKESFERYVENRKQLVRETARTHSIRGYEDDVDDAKAREFKDRLTRKAGDHKVEWDRARSEIRGSVQGLQEELTSLNERKSAKRQYKESSRQNIANYDRKVIDLQAKQDKIIYDEGSTATLQNQQQELEAQLSTTKEEQQNATWDADIAQYDSEMRTRKKRREELEEEMLEASRRAGDTANLDYLQKELKAAQHSLRTMIDAHQEKITSIIGHGWTPVTLENDYQRVLRNVTTQLTESENQRDGSVRDMEYAQTKINQVKQELKTAQSEIEQHKLLIRKAVDCEPQDYQFEMEQLEKTFENLGSDQKLYDFFTWSIKAAKEQDHCVLCKREFKNKNPLERNTMLSTAESFIKKFAPNASADSEAMLQETEEALKAGRDASSDFENWERLTNKMVPEKERMLKQLEDQHKGLIATSEGKDAVVDVKKTAKAEVEGLSRTMQSIIKNHGDIANHEQQIKDLADKQSDAASLRGLEAIQTDMKKIDEQFESISKSRTAAAAARDKMVSRINNLELQCSQVKGKLATAEFQLKEMKSLQSQQEEYRGLSTAARETIKSTDSEIQGLERELSAVQGRYDDENRRGNERDQAFQDAHSKLKQSVDKLDMVDEAIQDYHNKGGDERLARCRREIDGAKDELTRLENELRDTTRSINQLKEQLRSHDTIKRSIEDNQTYRKETRQCETLVQEIEELEKEDAEEDKRRYQKQCQRWQDRRNTAATNEANVAGQLSNIDGQIAQAEKDWNTDFKHAGREYKRAHIKVETTKAAVHDLDTYWRALDKAIMSYHSMKMEEINRIIAELWRNTYQGTDVDSIMIRSENETVKANKSYNYRVCMVKQDVEMDMRGRCSAGQKMLASIIIRLALAECFGSNCGVIALDEPTTNLDKDNIKALATSLERIIKFRRSQKNFQIIVITHDEEFLRQMNASEFTDKYFRVSRNKEQKSEIDLQGIAEIM